jgi:asparagine synthase (glutamine-hydrolysing)
MCGLCGVFSSVLSPDRREDAVWRMLQAMRRRGPDGQNVFWNGPCTLGHDRLAVIDTSAAGAQPMTENGVTIVYNGEMYTFREERCHLEREGFVFSGHTDTEVLLKLYLRYGQDCFTRLRGMYAFALWDSREHALICARDPLGIKPFLYSVLPEGIIFASELKGLLASGLVSRDVDRGSLRALLERGSVPQPGNILGNVRWLLPGQTLIVKEGAALEFRTFAPLRANTMDLRQAGWDELVDLGTSYLTDALERQMIADVPLGAFLSGGIDSSLLVALMARKHSKVRTFSVGFEGGLDTASEDETDDAIEVARYLGVEHTKIVVCQRDVADNLRAVAAGLDHPTVDGVNSWFVTRAARQELTVAISGTGGDELFAGYPWFAAMRDWNTAPFLQRLKRAVKGETFVSAFDKQYRIFSEEEAAALCSGTPPPGPRPDPLAESEVLNRVTGLVLHGYTRDQLLADIDTAAMWHSLEVRVPFLDEDLLSFALSLPPEAKIGSSRAGMNAVSYAGSGVKRLLLAIGGTLLPAGFANRAKRGFTLPFDGWLRGILAGNMADLLGSDVVRRRGFFDPQATERVRRDFEADRIHWTRPWLLMMTELWAQEVLDA